MKKLFPGWMSSNARNYIHPRPINQCRMSAFVAKDYFAKDKNRGCGTVSLCSSSSLMRSRYERVRGEREREKACISKQRPAIGKAPAGRLPV